MDYRAKLDQARSPKKWAGIYLFFFNSKYKENLHKYFQENAS